MYSLEDPHDLLKQFREVTKVLQGMSKYDSEYQKTLDEKRELKEEIKLLKLGQ